MYTVLGESHVPEVMAGCVPAPAVQDYGQGGQNLGGWVAAEPLPLSCPLREERSAYQPMWLKEKP